MNDTQIDANCMKSKVAVNAETHGIDSQSVSGELWMTFIAKINTGRVHKSTFGSTSNPSKFGNVQFRREIHPFA